MRNFLWVLLITFFVFAISACDSGVKQANSNAGNSNTAAKPEKNMKAQIADAEKEAYAAWEKKDGKFFEGFLADSFFGIGANGRTGKADVVKAISGNPCEIKGVTVSEGEAVEFGDGVVLFTSKNTQDMTCEGKAAPSPTWGATVYIKDGDKWKAAFHQNAPYAETKGEAPPRPADAPAPKAMEDSDKELTATFSEKEKSLWEAWAKKDTKPFEEVFAENYVGFHPGGRENRTEALKNIAEHKCEVKSQSLSDFHTAKIGGNLYMLTYKATMDGTCDGKPMPKEAWVSTIINKDGDKMKGLFHMSTPAG